MISIIIPSYNAQETIRKCLDAVLGQSCSDDFEIILVDSSFDKTPQIVADEYPRVKLFHRDRKTDPGSARNIGIENAAGTLIAFIDADCIAAENWLQKIYTAHQTSFRVVGGSVRPAPEANAVAWAGYIAEFREYLPAGEKRCVSHIPTCNISYDRSIFDEFGRFDGDCYPQEDLVFNYRLSQNGVKIFFDPDISVFHKHRTTITGFIAHQKRIGAATSKVLQELPLEGAFIARNKILGILCMPFLPLVKFFRTLSVFLKQYPEVAIKKPLSFLIFALGLIFWTLGFAQSIFQRKIN